jgi:hypothetical protein
MAYAMLEATRRHSRDVNTGALATINEAQPLVNPNIKGMNAQQRLSSSRPITSSAAESDDEGSQRLQLALEVNDTYGREKGPSMSSEKITAEELRRIIREELELKALNEAVDHKSINTVIGVASKLLGAIEAFKDKAPPSAINAVTPHLGELEKVLENMAENPGSYVPRPKIEPKKVSLKAVK